MIVEELDKESGAILFKKDEESRSLESLMTEVSTMKETIKKLEKRIKALESNK